MKGILCFGASITYGRGEQPEHGWVGRLHEWFSPQDTYNAVFNLGVSGQTIAELLERFETEAHARIRLHRPNNSYTILISAGTNNARWVGKPKDKKTLTTDEEFEEQVRTLLKKAKGMKAKLGYIGLTPIDEQRTIPFDDVSSFTNERVQEHNTMIKNICDELSIPFLDVFNLLEPEHLADGLHPNSEGYDKIWKTIQQWLEKESLLP
ncbi:hypothetical protein GOV07_02220 [Candidatus Woesearchaeota archaeon]|nr:hypothetical protein [Candidatus Woesearchaeota archaeon]